MKLENQCVSLELAIKLKELGVKQESLHFWVRHGKEDFRLMDVECPAGYLNLIKAGYDIYSAFTPAELGEILPINIKGYFLTIIKMGTKEYYWSVRYMENLMNNESKQWHWRQLDNSLANSLAKMLIYLKKNKLI